MGKKDACYHKVKARYKVFPSAYASGALAKCRKVGAKNWGNKKKKKKMKHKNKPFKKHKMYCKDGSVKKANTMADHLKFKKMGCGHKPIKNK